MVRTSLMLLVAVLLGACGGQLPVADDADPAAERQLEYADFGPAQPTPTPDDIFGLTPEQRLGFLDYFNAPAQAQTAGHRRLADYIEEFGTDFNYQGETLTASETLGQAEGNCLSLAILTTALADVAEIEVGYQLVDSDPVFEVEGNVALRQRHVRSYLYQPDYQPDPSALIIRRPGIIVDYFPSGRERFIGNISADEYLAMFYRNRAATLIIEADYSAAFWHLQESFRYAPGHVDGINMMAVLHRRIGDEQRAENIYRYGLANAADSVSLLRNYRRLLIAQGRDEEVKEINARLARLDDPSPFEWLDMAREAYGEEDYRLAKIMYERALERANYLHDAYIGKARAELQLGELSAAESSLKAALEYAGGAEVGNLYRAKLAALDKVQSRRCNNIGPDGDCVRP